MHKNALEKACNRWMAIESLKPLTEDDDVYGHNFVSHLADGDVCRHDIMLYAHGFVMENRL